MGQTPRDNNTEPSLELPSLPGFGRRKKSRKSRGPAESPEPTYDGTEVPTDEAAEPSLNGHGPGTQEAHVPDGQDSQELDDLAPRRRVEKRRTDKAPKQPRKQRSKPLLPVALAAVLTGLFVGAAGALGTYGAMTGCEAVRGVSTCGGAPGFFILVAILALMVLLGAAVLHVAKVNDPASTSFLAVGLVAVIAMLVLLDVIFSAWMFVVIPVLTALAFLLAQWVTSRFTEDTGRRDWT